VTAKLCRIFAGIFLLLFLFVLCGGGVSAQEGGTVEPFDDPALPGWERSDNTVIEGGMLRIEPDGFAFWPGFFHEGMIQIFAALEGDGVLEIHYMRTDPSAYVLQLTAREIVIFREREGHREPINATDIGMPIGEFGSIQINVTGDEHHVIVNDAIELVATDPERLPAGGVMLHVQGEALAIFDEFIVTPLGGEMPGEGEGEPVEPGEAEPRPEAVGERLPLSELSWIRLGGPPGGLGYDIRYKFDDPNIWYVTDANAGVHISRDNGRTWEQSNTGIHTVGGASGDSIPIFSLTVDPHNPQIIWAGTDMSGSIYKSTDGGETWTEKSQGVIHEHEILLSFRGFTVDPRSSDIVYAMGELQKPGNNVWGLNVGGVVYKTTDGGDSWQRIWDGQIPSSLARYLWIDPRDPDVLYVSTGIFDRGGIGMGDPDQDPDPFGGLGVLKSTDGGKTWQVLGAENGLEFLLVGSLFMHPEDPDVLLAAAGHVCSELAWQHYTQQGHSPMGVYRTTDGGQTWTQVLEPESEILVQAFSAVDICPSDPDIVYAGSDVAVYRSEDGGLKWTKMSGGPTGWGPAGVRAGWPIDLQCDPRDTDRVFANNYSGGNFLSEDGGRTWINASTGYSGAQVIGIAVDPFNPARVFVGGRSGAWYSEDSGITWQGIHNPGDPKALAGGEQGGVAFDPSKQNHILLGGGEGILAWDGGEPTWKIRPLFQDYGPETSVIEFAPSDPYLVYAASANHNTMVHGDVYEAGRGVVVSRDGGATWEVITGSQFSDVPVTDLSVDPKDANVVYVATKSGLFKTSDGGANWVDVSNLSKGKPVRTVGVSPADSQRVMAGVQYQGLYLSEDGGETWRQVTAGLEPNGIHRDIIFDPLDPNIVYTCDVTSGVYRSEDGGMTWLKLNQGLTTRAVTNLSLSADGVHLYAATSGFGVFRLDFNGQPPVSSGVVLFDEGVGEEPEAEVEPPPEPEPEPEQVEEPPVVEEPAEALEDARGSRLPCLGGAFSLVLLGFVGWRRIPSWKRLSG
jgi:photosystem II stability/assembly factor-like uncharacterized protein